MKFFDKIQIFFLAWCFLVHAAQNANGQIQPSFENFQIKDGLPSTTIYNLKFAKNNLLYLAHSKGLSSYDGGFFRNFYNVYQPNTELSNIMEAPNGTIYAKAFNNTVYELKNDTLQFVFWANNNSGFSNSCMIKDEIIAIGTDSFFVFNTIHKTKKGFPFPKPVAKWPNAKIIQGFWTDNDSSKLSLLLVDDRRNFYNVRTTSETEFPIMHFSGGQAFATKQKTLKELTWIDKNKKILNADNNDSKVNYVNIIDKEIYINTNNGIYVANQNFEIIRHFNFGQSSTTAIAKSPDDNFFISTLENGLIKVPSFDNIQLANLKYACNQFAITTDGRILLEKRLHEKDAKDNIDVPIQLVADENQIWLERAIQQARSFGYTFKHIPKDAVAALPIIKDFTILPNAILFGTQGGLIVYSEKDNYHWLQAFELDKEKKYYPFKKLSIHQEYVPSVKYDEINDKLIVNTYAGLFELTKNNPNSTQLPDPVNTSVKDIEFWEGQLLLATAANGVTVWDGKKYFYNSPRFPTKGYLKHFYKTKNQLWLHGDEGIYVFSKDGNKVYNSSSGVPVENVKNIFISDSHIYINHGNRIASVPKATYQTASKQSTIIVHSIKQGQQKIKQNAILAYYQNDISIAFSYISYDGINKHIAYKVNGQRPIHLSNTARIINIPNLSPDYYTIELFSVENDNISAKPMQIVKFRITPPFYKTLWFTLLLVVLSLLVAFFIARYILNNYKRDALHKEAQLLMEKELDKSMLTSIKAQMNPHFIFNALNTIQSYIYSNEKQNASIYISKFSDLTRSILEMSNKETVTLDEEIKSLKLYLELEQMRFEDSMSYDITVADNISLEAIKIPSMLVQPYIENAIKHGLLHKKTDRRLYLSYTLDGSMLTITVDDNGIGRKRSEELNTIKNRHHQSFAMDANKKRLEILKNNSEGIHFEIIDKLGDKGEALGTKVVIRLKV